MIKLPSFYIVPACLVFALPARADEPAPSPESVPVLIHAGDGLVLLDDLSCLRAACDGRVTLGRHHVTVKREKDGQWETELERDVDISAVAPIAAPAGRGGSAFGLGFVTSFCASAPSARVRL